MTGHNAHLNRCLGYPRSRSNRGSVLIIVMWVALGLVSVTLYFAQAMFFEFRASDQYLQGLQAQQALEGGLRYAKHVLANLEEPGTMPEASTYTTEKGLVGKSIFWFLGKHDNPSNQTLPAFSLVDEGGKLDINLATQEMLEALPNMTPEFAAAIIDWRDEDEEVSDGGAEASTYGRLMPSRGIKNAPFDSVDELMMVYGADPLVVYGEDTNRNGILDPNENDGSLTPPADNADGSLDAGLVDYLTVFTRAEAEADSETAQSGDASNTLTLQEGEATLKVNVNTASAVVLACLPGMDEQKAQQIISARASQSTLGEDITWVSEALGDSGLSETQDYLVGTSHAYSVDVVAVGQNGQGFRRSQFLIDTGGEEPTVVFRRDLEREGWALGMPLKEEIKMFVSQWRVK
jgi:type II secretory pathway component PulK